MERAFRQPPMPPLHSFIRRNRPSAISSNDHRHWFHCRPISAGPHIRQMPYFHRMEGTISRTGRVRLKWSKRAGLRARYRARRRRAKKIVKEHKPGILRRFPTASCHLQHLRCGPVARLLLPDSWGNTRCRVSQEAQSGSFPANCASLDCAATPIPLFGVSTAIFSPKYSIPSILFT